MKVHEYEGIMDELMICETSGYKLDYPNKVNVKETS